MDLFLAILGWTTFGIAILVGLVLDLVGLFGNWIILAAVALAWLITGFEHFSIWALLIMAGFAVVGEILEAAASGYGAAKFGGGRGAIVSSVVGCILGAMAGTPLIPIPIVGTLIGACLGAFLAAALYEYLVREKRPGQAAWTGLGAALGKVLGMFAKTFMGFLMLIAAALSF